jgi:hypothetical protein
MSKRYYLSDVEDYPQEDGSILRRAVVAEYADYVAEILGNKALCLVTTNNHGPLISDSRIDAMPVFPLDAKINAMQSSAKNQMIAAMSGRGFSTGLISSADGYRDVIRGIGRELNVNFDENNFDISE